MDVPSLGDPRMFHLPLRRTLTALLSLACAFSLLVVILAIVQSGTGSLVLITDAGVAFLLEGFAVWLLVRHRIWLDGTVVAKRLVRTETADLSRVTSVALVRSGPFQRPVLRCEGSGSLSIVCSTLSHGDLERLIEALSANRDNRVVLPAITDLRELQTSRRRHRP